MRCYSLLKSRLANRIPILNWTISDGIETSRVGPFNAISVLLKTAVRHHIANGHPKMDSDSRQIIDLFARSGSPGWAGAGKASFGSG